MIAIVGAGGYVGGAFVESLQSKQIPFHPLRRDQIDGNSVQDIADTLKSIGATFLINAAGFTGKPNVDACEIQKQQCLYGNAVLPGILSDATSLAGIPWGHVSSGCIYNGSAPDGSGFDEEATPNFSFRSGNCSFYSGCKALGEEILQSDANCYIWRLRIPFNHVDSQRNYLSKLMRYEKLLNATNSLSHLGDYVESCIKCLTDDVPKGVYNLTCQGSITTMEVVELIKKSGVTDKDFRFFADEAEFMRESAVAPRSNCVLDTSKAGNAGIGLRCVREAIKDSLARWTTQE